MAEELKDFRPLPLRLLSLGHRVAHRLTGGRVGSLVPGEQSPRGKVLAAITALHRRAYAWTGGIVGGSAGGLPTLLLTTTGNKTGLRRTVPLPYLPDGPRFVVMGSNSGQAQHPAWVRNVQAKPGVQVQVGFRRFEAFAHVATPAERAALWPRVVAAMPMYGDYAEVAPREIALVILRPSP